MNQAPRRRLTTTEFLEWEQRQELRYEFDGTTIVAMTGGTVAHSTIQTNLARAVSERLRGKPCRFHGSHLKVEVSGRIRYPDGFVVCSPVQPTATVVANPVIIFEVLSDGTEPTDMFVKNREYAATPSVQRYVMLLQTEIGGLMFERVGADWVGADWVGRILSPGDILPLPEVGIAVPLSEIYEGLDFTGEEAPTSVPSP